jgi:CheY-like chemotaxis protein
MAPRRWGPPLGAATAGLATRRRRGARGSGELKDGYPMTKRILIADDERPIADLLTTALTQEGYEAVGTTESLRFFDAVTELQPDLILLDLRMPYLNGRDELQLMRMNPQTGRIPVIVVTADPDARREEADYRNLGVVAIVYKPFDLNTLIRLVKQTIGEPQEVAK